VSAPIVFLVDTASTDEIADHLVRSDASFIPPLSNRVEIADYARKISTRAVRFEAWDGGLVGLLAAYCNDPFGRAGYITSVSVEQAWRGKGIASRLLDQCVRHLQELGFEWIELEVDPANESAVRLYAKKGFRAGTRDNKTMIMRLELGKEAG
jgi:ribosomal protein S18 acetylase RimI-like enzyme